MRTLLVSSCLLFCSLHSFAQSDTIYFDYGGGGHLAQVPKKEAKYYRLPVIKEGDKYKIEDYYINGKLQRSAYVNSPDSMLYDGYATEYYENGRKREYGNYYRGVKVGQWKLKYEDTDKVWAAITYYNSTSDTLNVMRSFYRSGKLKRIEYEIKGPIKDSSRSVGLCYAESGEEISFTSFEVMPEPPFDVFKYLCHTVRYPNAARENNIQGRINVQFCVMKDGSIQEIKVIGKFDVYLAKEAVRVVKAMPKWKPGKQDDEVVKVFYTLPITFKLE